MRTPKRCDHPECNMLHNPAATPWRDLCPGYKEREREWKRQNPPPYTERKRAYQHAYYVRVTKPKREAQR